MAGPALSTLLFDLDGTLIDSREDIANAVNHGLEEVGEKIKPHGEIVPFIGNGLNKLMCDVLARAYDEDVGRAVDSFYAFYSEHCVDATVLYDDVEKRVREFSKTLKLGIVTNKPRKLACKILNEYRLTPFFNVIYGGDSFKEKKPHPRPLLEALTSLEAPPRSALIIGDGWQDIEAGRRAGLQTCLAQYGFGFDSKTLELKPDHVIKKFSELKEIVS